MLGRFTRYFSVGVVNTLIHWGLFLIVYGLLGVEQSLSNLIAFLVAVTFSFFANASVTFQAQATPVRYAAFVVFMGGLSWTVGEISDRSGFSPLFTLIVFSGLSLVVGFLFSHYVVFRRSA